MEGESNGAENVVTNSATAAAASAESAAGAAAGAESAAGAAAAAAESAAAHVEAVQTAVENVGQEVQAAAAQVTEAAVETAVAQIERDLEAENTWLQQQMDSLRVELAQVRESIPSIAAIREAVATEAASLLSNLRELLHPTTPAPASEGAGVPEVPPEVPAAPSRKKNVRLI